MTMHQKQSKGAGLVLIDETALATLTDEIRALRAEVRDLKPPPKMLLTIKEAAQFLGKSERTINRMIAQGVLATEYVGRTRMVRRP